MADTLRMQFGTAREDLPTLDRPGVYAVILCPDGKIATVSAGGDVVHLPGGGIEPGESEREALERELREEIGHIPGAVERLGFASQYCHLPARRVNLNKICHYYRVLEADLLPADPGKYTCVWLAPEEAIRALAHESHAWAVGMAVARS